MMNMDWSNEQIEQWNKLQEFIKTGRTLSDWQVIELYNLFELLVSTFRSKIIIVNGVSMDKATFENYLYTEFAKGTPLKSISVLETEQYATGIVQQQTLAGQKIIKFAVTHEKPVVPTVTAEYVPPSQRTIEGQAKPVAPIVRQSFFEVVERIEGLPKLYEHQAEALAAIRQYKKLSIQIPTGLGKTILGIAAIREFGTPAIVIVPTVILMYQWGAEFKKYGVTASYVFAEQKNFGPITIITYNSARDYINNLKQYKIVIFDEVHHLYGDITRQLLYAIYDTAEYIIGLSATTKQEYEKGHKIQEQFMPTRIEKVPASFKGTPFEVPVTVNYMGVTLTPEERDSYKSDTTTINKAIHTLGEPENWARAAGSPSDKYAALGRAALFALQNRRFTLSNAEEKMKAAVDIIKSKPDTQFLVFLESVPAAEKLATMLNEVHIGSALITSSVSMVARLEAFDLFKSGKFNVLISVFALEEGINLPDLDTAIWMGSSRISQRYVIQRLGRITRPKAGKVATLYWIYAFNTVEVGNISRTRELI